MNKLIMEFLGTFFFVLTIVMTGNPNAIACMLMAWVYIGGYVSGGHYNPAVTLAVALVQKWSWLKAAKYMIAQILGAFLAMQIALTLSGKAVLTIFDTSANLAQIFTMETLLTFVLAFIVLVVATAPQFRESRIFGLAIGFTIPALIALGGPISGAIFNPAIILGSLLFVLVSGGSIMAHAYVPAQFLGALLAAAAFKYLYRNH